MKVIYLIVSVFFMLFLSSCIRDEAPNAEADIEYCIIKDKDILITLGDTLKAVPTDNNRITIFVKFDADLTKISPEFILTDGATLKTEDGKTEFDFSNAQEHTFTVISQDGQWQKAYTLRFVVPKIVKYCRFEHFELDQEKQKYYQWYEVDEIEAAEGLERVKYYYWATGNPGFEIIASGKAAMEYPSIPCDLGVQGNGNGVKLETKRTGSLGDIVKMPIAAGNLFMGSFDPQEAIKGGDKALKATKFGVPFSEKPLRLKGHYKYKAGDVFWDKNKNVIDRRDICDIYGVLYKNTIEENGKEVGILLDGADVLSNPNIVALARIKNPVETDVWSDFDLKFEYKEEIDPVKLANYKYNLAVVFSSSIDGAYFNGAVGSTLWIDEVEIVCE